MYHPLYMEPDPDRCSVPSVAEQYTHLPRPARQAMERWLGTRPLKELKDHLAAMHQYITTHVLSVCDQEDYSVNVDPAVARVADMMAMLYAANGRWARAHGRPEDVHGDIVDVQLTDGQDSQAQGLTVEDFVNDTLSDHVDPGLDMVKFHDMHAPGLSAQLVSYAQLAPFALQTQTKAKLFEFENRIRHMQGRRSLVRRCWRWKEGVGLDTRIWAYCTSEVECTA